MTSCLVIQHVDPEGPYAIAGALERAGVTVDIRSAGHAAAFPTDLAGFDGLVVMGGPMSATGDEGFATRRAELDLLADALHRGLPTLGVCLGAQLLALAGGGAVYPGGAGPEIGWGPVALTEEAGDDLLLKGLPAELTVMHWHGDTFDPPPAAALLAVSPRYRSQAFRCGAQAWGLQFHLEIDQAAVTAFIAAFGADALAAGTTPETIEADSAAALTVLAPWRDRVLGRFAELVVAHHRQPTADRSEAVSNK
jgi:GMP synthase-like glutamine amidotransferase